MSGEHKETDYEAPIQKKQGGRKNKGGGSQSHDPQIAEYMRESNQFLNAHISVKLR